MNHLNILSYSAIDEKRILHFIHLITEINEEDKSVMRDAFARHMSKINNTYALHDQTT